MLLDLIYFPNDTLSMLQSSSNNFFVKNRLCFHLNSDHNLYFFNLDADYKFSWDKK